jgi:hypothetical protein
MNRLRPHSLAAPACVMVPASLLPVGCRGFDGGAGLLLRDHMSSHRDGLKSRES